MSSNRLRIYLNTAIHLIQQFHPLDIFQCAPQVFLRVRLQRDDRLDTLLPQQLKKPLKGEGPLPHRQVLIGAAMVVMEVYLADPGAEGIHPLIEARQGKRVEVASVKTETNIPRPLQCVQEKAERFRTVLIDIFKCHLCPPLGDCFHKATPGIHTVFQPLFFMRDIVSLIKGGVTHHGPGSETGYQIKDLPETFHGHLSYLPVQSAGSQVEKGGVQCNGQARAMQGIRYVTEFISAEMVEGKTIQTNLRIDPLFKDYIKVLIDQHPKGHIDLDFFQYIVHIQQIRTTVYDSYSSGDTLYHNTPPLDNRAVIFFLQLKTLLVR